MTLMGLTRSPNAPFLGRGDVPGHRAGRRRRRDPAQDPRRRDRDDLPGPDDVAEPGPEDRAPDRGADPGARWTSTRPRRASARSSCSSGSGIPRARDRAEAVPARVLRRHAPAGDDRPGAVVRPQAADRRRAHDRAGRDDPGADPGSDPCPARRDRRRGDPGDPRPRRRGRHRRPRRGHVRRPDRGAGHARRDLLRPPAPLHLGPARLDRPRRPRPSRRGCRRSPGCRRRWPTARRAATSRRAARTRSTSATRRPPSSSAPASPRGTPTAAGSTARPSASCAWSTARSGSSRPGSGVA